MPTSDPSNIGPIVSEMIRLFPRSVLDLGVGFGKYGVLVREYLDAGRGLVARADWTTRLVGVEAHAPYKSALHDAVYDEFRVEDFGRSYRDYRDFDLVLMLDSLEHLEREPAELMLTYLLEHNAHVLVSCPDGPLPQDAVNGNDHERHLSTWTEADFLRLGGRTIHKGLCVVSSIPGRA